MKERICPRCGGDVTKTTGFLSMYKPYQCLSCDRKFTEDELKDKVSTEKPKWWDNAFRR